MQTMTIEPVFGHGAVWGDEDDMGDGTLIGYRVVSKTTGAVLGFGETRDEALTNARRKMFPVEV